MENLDVRVASGDALDIKKRAAQLRSDDRRRFREIQRRHASLRRRDPEGWLRYMDAVLAFLPDTPTQRSPLSTPACPRVRSKHRRRSGRASSSAGSGGDDDGDGGEDDPLVVEPQSFAPSSGAPLSQFEISAPAQREGLRRIIRAIGQKLGKDACVRKGLCRVGDSRESSLEAQIRRALEAGDLSQTEIARELGISRTTVARVASRTRALEIRP